MITPEQCRAARALLAWTQADAARAAHVNSQTVRDFEQGKKRPQDSTLTVLKQAFEARGVEFTNGDAPGVRLHKR